MVKAIRVDETGPASVMKLTEVAVGAPGPGEALVLHTAIGVNFIDTYFRSGLYKAPTLPFIPGAEAAGVVEAVGEGVADIAVGNRVCYAGAVGAYAEKRLIAADRLVPIPDAIDDRTAAACLLKGLTVQYLVRRTFPVGPEHTVLWHAGAGGVGLIAGQWLKDIGCTSIATAGGPDKVALAKAAGFTHVIDYRADDFVAEVARLTGGAKCEVVYDSVGKDTFPGSLDCLKPLGLFVTFGNASGAIAPMEPAILNTKGSLYMTRPKLFDYAAKRADLLAMAADLFGMIEKGAVTIQINQAFPLAEAARCHEQMEARGTTGSTILTV